MFNILVCGGRDFNNKKLLYDVLLNYCWKNGFHHPKDAMTPVGISIISGMAKGADTLGWLFAKDYGLDIFSFPADWKHQGNSAGPIRNQKMIDETPGGVDLVIAFPTKNSRGTYDMIRRAEKAGIKTIIVKEEE